MKRILISLALLPVLAVPAFAVTVYNSDGTIRYTDESTTVPGAVTTAASEFLTKPFEEYSVTEGFLLLFLILAFCWIVWKIIKEVL